MTRKSKLGYKLVKGLFGRYEEIPEEWELKQISSILQITMGQSPPSSSYNQKGEGLPFYQGVTDFGTMYPKSTVWCTKPKKTADKNFLLFSVRAPVGETNLTNTKCCLGRGIAALNSLNSNIMYYYYLLSQNKNVFKIYAQGTIYEAINSNEIAHTKLLHTENSLEQIKIASILSGVDALIESTQKLIEKTERLKKGLMQKLLTRGIGHTKFKKVKWLFGKEIEIPREWELKQISSILQITMGQSPPSSSYNQKGEGLPFYQGVTDFGTMYPKSTVWCTKPKKTADKNFLLFSVRAPVGETNLTNTKCCLGRGIAALNSLNSNIMYYYYLLSQNKNVFKIYAQGTIYESINSNEIAHTELLHTENSLEQTKIASILSGIDAYIQKNQEYKKKIEHLKKGLMQNLLTGKIRVPLNDELLGSS